MVSVRGLATFLAGGASLASQMAPEGSHAPSVPCPWHGLHETSFLHPLPWEQSSWCTCRALELTLPARASLHDVLGSGGCMGMHTSARHAAQAVARITARDWGMLDSGAAMVGLLWHT